MGNCLFRLDMLSEKAKEKLPGILDEMGFADRYQIDLKVGVLSTNIRRSVMERAFHLAECAAKGEDGYLVHIRQTTYAEIWIPKTEATSLKKAYHAALIHAENGYPVDQDVAFSVGSAEDSSIPSSCARYRDDCLIDCLPDED